MGVIFDRRVQIGAVKQSFGEFMSLNTRKIDQMVTGCPRLLLLL